MSPWDEVTLIVAPFSGVTLLGLTIVSAREVSSGVMSTVSQSRVAPAVGLYEPMIVSFCAVTGSLLDKMVMSVVSGWEVVVAVLRRSSVLEGSIPGESISARTGCSGSAIVAAGDAMDEASFSGAWVFDEAEDGVVSHGRSSVNAAVRS